MSHINFEFKAKANDIIQLENKLQKLNPHFKGTDLQKDTYYNVPYGRLKLREGNIENALIYYERADDAASKQSNVILYQHTPSEQLNAILTKIHGIKTIVIKKRKIYFVDNVKIHFDEVDQLGTFIEVEAIDSDGSIGIDKLKRQCSEFSDFFNIRSEDYLACSYSDMLLAKS